MAQIVDIAQQTSIEQGGISYIVIAVVGCCITGLILLLFKKTNKQILQKQIDNSPKEEKSTQSKLDESAQIKQQIIQQKSQKTVKILTIKQCQQTYGDQFIGCFSLRQKNSIESATCITFKGSNVLLSNTKNQLILYCLKKWKKQKTQPQRFFTSLDNNTGTAVAIGNKYYYVALSFDKTIAYYEFLGGEGGVYFRLVKKFERNILASNAAYLFVPQNQKYLASVGNHSDTIIDVWSMEGKKLYAVNTYQIQHYFIGSSIDKLLVRGWTSQVKLFTFREEKQGNFYKLEKNIHLSHQQKPIIAIIDNMGLYAITVLDQGEVFLWNIKEKSHSQTKLLEVKFKDLQLNEIKHCVIHSIKLVNQRLKTIIAISDDNNVHIYDRSLKLILKIEGVEVAYMNMIGSNKSMILCTTNKENKVFVWNMNKIVSNLEEYLQN